MHAPKAILLERYRLSKAKPSTIPADVSIKLVKEDGVSKFVDQVLYQSTVGIYYMQLLQQGLTLPKQWELYQSLTPVQLKLTIL